MTVPGLVARVAFAVLALVLVAALALSPAADSKTITSPTEASDAPGIPTP